MRGHRCYLLVQSPGIALFPTANIHPLGQTNQKRRVNTRVQWPHFALSRVLLVVGKISLRECCSSLNISWWTKFHGSYKVVLNSTFNSIDAIRIMCTIYKTIQSVQLDQKTFIFTISGSQTARFTSELIDTRPVAIFQKPHVLQRNSHPGAHNGQHVCLLVLTSCWTMAHNGPTVTIEFKGMDLVNFHISL